VGVAKLDVTEFKDAFAAMSDSELRDYKFLSSFIFNRCGLKFSKTVSMSCEDRSKLNCWGGVNSKQYPDELAKLLVFIYENRLKIHSYCEIGVERGGTFFIIDSFLRAINPNMGESLGIDKDISGNRRGIFEKYVKAYPQAKYRLIHSAHFKPSQRYDLCFIDGDHKYIGAKRDFELMQAFSNYIALHDIKFVNHDAEVERLWGEIEGEKTEFLNEDDLFPMPVGIGLWKKDIKFSVIASAIHSDLYTQCYNSISAGSNISFEVIFAGNVLPKEKMPINFKYIYTEVNPLQCVEIAARASSGEYLIDIADDLLFSEGFLDRTNHYLSKLYMDDMIVGGRYQTNGVFWDNILTFDKKGVNSPVVPFLPALKRRVWEEVGGIDRRFSYALFDIDVLLRFYAKGYSPFIAPDNWGNEIRNRSVKSILCGGTDRLGRRLLNRFWVENGLVIKNRKEAVESFDDKNILTVNQYEF